MAREQESVDVADMPQLRELAEEMRRTHRPKALCVDGEEVAIIVPVAPKRRRALGKPITAGDSLWKLIGMADADTVTDVSEQHDRYLIAAKLAQSL